MAMTLFDCMDLSYVSLKYKLEVPRTSTKLEVRIWDAYGRSCEYPDHQR